MTVNRSNFKKLTAVLLILLLAIALFPATSFADEILDSEATDAAPETEEGNEVEEIEPEEVTEEKQVVSEVVFTLDRQNYSVDGTSYSMDVAPYIQDSRIMVPVAHVSRALGAEVHWDPDTRTVTVTSGDDVITMVIGSATLLKNGLFFDEMDTLAVIRDIGGGLGRTMIPVSRLARALNVEYIWNAATRSAIFMPAAIEAVEPTIQPIVIDKAGTFGHATSIITINNSVIIKAEDVTLQNYIITGDLIVAEEVGEGSVHLKNVTVRGSTYIRGGGMETIYIDGGAYNDIIIEKIGGNIRIVYINAEGGEIIIAEGVGEGEIVLEGDFDKVTVLSSDVIVHLKGDTTVVELLVDEDAPNVTIIIDEDAVVELLTSDSRNLIVEGEGTVKKDGGEAKSTIKYGSDITRPVLTFPGGGGGGGGYSAPKASNIKIETIDKEYILNSGTGTDIEFSIKQDEEYIAISVDLDLRSIVTIAYKPENKEISHTFSQGTIKVTTTLLQQIGLLKESEIKDGSVFGQTLNGKEFTISLINPNDSTKITKYKAIFTLEDK